MEENKSKIIFYDEKELEKAKTLLAFNNSNESMLDGVGDALSTDLGSSYPSAAMRSTDAVKRFSQANPKGLFIAFLVLLGIITLCWTLLI